MTLKDHASGPGVNPRDIFLFFFYGVVVVIATAGAEATHRQEGQIWLFLPLMMEYTQPALQLQLLTERQNFGGTDFTGVTISH